MSMFTNTKKTKKFILVLVFLILFNFVMPGAIKADTMLSGDSIEEEKDDSYGYETSERKKEGGFFDIGTNLSKLLFFFERSIIMIANNMFCDDKHQGEYSEFSDGSVDVKLYLTPENIIKGRFLLFDPDIFQDVANVEEEDEDEYFDDGEGKSIVQGKTKLRETVAGWYYALRNLAIVALLSILVYVGIRMIISTVSQDKAKYKAMFKDWLVALCLLIAMHYIMISILDISSKLVDAIGTSGSGASQTEILMKKIGSITSASSSYTVTTTDKDEEGKTKTYGDIRSVYINEGIDEDGNITVEGIEFYDVGNAFAFMLLLLAIILYTILFAAKYLIREFTLIFLVLLGPISCITYPIDKIADGKAQAFNKWFSEFLFNVIIQPFHLLIYIVLIGSATQLADDNILYSIICFAVMLPAEKFIKEMFGFRDKLGSPLGAMATGAFASQLFNKMRGGGSSSSKSGNSSNSGENDSTPNNLPPKTVKDSNLVDGGTGGTPGRGAQGGQGGQGDQDNNTPPGTVKENKGYEDEDIPELSSGEESGEGDYTADTYSNSEDQVADAERTTLGEKTEDGQIDKENLTDEQKELLGTSDKEEQEDGDIKQKEDNSDDDKKVINSGNNKENETNENKEKSLKDKLINKAKNAKNQVENSKIMAIHNQRVSKKHGSTNRRQRWKNRGKKILPKGKSVAKETLKLGAGLVATTGFIVTGNGKEALAIATGTGAYLGKKAKEGGKRVIKGVTGAFNDYRNGLRSDDSKEKKALKDFKADSKQMDKAVYSYRKNHGGQDPGYEALENEMEDRFELSRYGLTDDQIDDALPIYQQKKDELLKKGMEGERAKEIAADSATEDVKLSDAYSAKDFRDSKTMSNAYKGLKERLMQVSGVNEDIADHYAREHLINAAKMKSVSESEIALPPVREKSTIPSKNNLYGKLKVNEPISKEQQEEVLVMQDVLSEVGLGEDQIKQVIEYSTGDTNEKIIASFGENVRYILNNEINEGTVVDIKSGNNNIDIIRKNASQVTENIERLGVSKQTGLSINKDGEKISEIRNLETQELKDTSFREVGGKAIRGELSINDKNNLSENTLYIAEQYKNIANGGNNSTARNELKREAASIEYKVSDNIQNQTNIASSIKEGKNNSNTLKDAQVQKIVTGEMKQRKNNSNVLKDAQVQKIVTGEMKERKNNSNVLKDAQVQKIVTGEMKERKNNSNKLEDGQVQKSIADSIQGNNISQQPNRKRKYGHKPNQ